MTTSRNQWKSKSTEILESKRAEVWEWKCSEMHLFICVTDPPKLQNTKKIFWWKCISVQIRKIAKYPNFQKCLKSNHTVDNKMSEKIHCLILGQRKTGCPPQKFPVQATALITVQLIHKPLRQNVKWVWMKDKILWWF